MAKGKRQARWESLLAAVQTDPELARILYLATAELYENHAKFHVTKQAMSDAYCAAEWHYLHSRKGKKSGK